MKDASSIRQKLKQAAYRHLKKRLEAGLKVTPSNCIHNEKVPPTTFMGSTGTGPCHNIGMCRHPWPEGQWPGVCDEFHSDRSTGCPHFETRYPKDGIKGSFKRFVAEAPLSELGREGLHDVVAYLWVLGEDAPGRSVVAEELDTVEVNGVSIIADTAESRAALETLVQQVGKLETVEAMEQELVDTQIKLHDAQHTLKRVQMEYDEAKERGMKPPAAIVHEPGAPFTNSAARKPWWARVFGGWS